MTGTREQWREDLKVFLRSIQKPNLPIDRLRDDDGLVASGLIDSLAMLQIVLYLESTYKIDFSVTGVDPERLRSMASILDLIEQECA
jgi:acyl carrier protein